MKVIFLAYREWSLDVYKAIERHPNVQFCVLCKTQVELEKLDLNDFDLIISCGWSEELGNETLSKIKAIGVHCAELDRYSYGSPIQLQIIDGITRTKYFHKSLLLTVKLANATAVRSNPDIIIIICKNR